MRNARQGENKMDRGDADCYCPTLSLAPATGRARQGNTNSRWHVLAIASLLIAAAILSWMMFSPNMASADTGTTEAESQDETPSPTPTPESTPQPPEPEPKSPPDTDGQTPLQDSQDQAPAEDGQDQAPAESGDGQTPPQDGQDQAPAEDGQDQAPAESGDGQTPPQDGQDQAPTEGDDDQAQPQDSQDQTPTEGDGQAPVEDGDDQAPTVGDDQTPAEGGDSQTLPQDSQAQAPTVGDGQSPPQGSQDQNPVEGGDDQAPVEGGDGQTPVEGGDGQTPPQDSQDQSSPEAKDTTPPQTKTPPEIVLPPYFPLVPSGFTFTQDEDIGTEILPEATGGAGGFSYSLSPSLPEGLSFDPETRALTGAPAASGSFLMTYTATDADGGQVQWAFAIEVFAVAASTANEPEEEAPYSVAPTVTIEGVPETISSLDPLEVTFDFSEDVTGFEAADITVDNGSLADLTGSSAAYSATVTPTGPGDLTVTVAAQSVQAVQGENNADGPPEAETATARLITKPKFTKGPPGITRSVQEDIAAGTRVGGTVAARDPDGDTLTYSLSGSDLFDIDPATGGISVAAGAVLDYETAQSHTVTVGVTDGEDADGNPETDPAIDDTVEVTISVYDVHEPPAKPDKPLVIRSSGDPAASLEVSWTAPDNSGRPAITGYQVRHRKNGDKHKNDWIEQTVTGAATSATITGLYPDIKYRVQVAATNDEGTGPWSKAETKRTADWTISIEGPEGPRTTGAPFVVRVIIPEVGVVDPVSVGYGATNASLPQQTDAFRGDGGDYQVHFRVTPEHENRSGSWPFEVRFTASYEGREVSWPVTVDPDPPVVTISGPGEPQSGTFEVRFSLSEKNAGFEESDVTVTNGSVTDFSGSERSYTARITPESSGQVTVAVPAGALQDGASHQNKAAQYSVTADLGEPTVSINGVPATISSVDPLQVTFTFSEDVAGFKTADVTVENGSLEEWAGSGADYSATVTPDGGGDLTVTVSARAARGKNNVRGPLEAETATAVRTGPATFITGPKGPLTTGDPFDIRITYLGLSDGATFGESILNATLGGEVFPGDDGVREVTVTPDPPRSHGDQAGDHGQV